MTSSNIIKSTDFASLTTSPTPRYKRVQGGNSWASAMFRFTADSFTYAARLIDNLDRFHFQSRGDLTTVLNTAQNHDHDQDTLQASAPTGITFYCRGIEIATFTEEDIEIKRATAAYAFDDHLIEKLRAFGIPEAFKIPLHREKEQSQKK
ncbi:hypothetical protein [Acidaminobacter sp.]|uniref:hypothetical protein n=1 Tax=Acidaminobacter sp. TaxID=1872102 RepID=UPI00256D7C98|nr:hypothetical protein [Acidaminobacter sp.]MDK9711509.1 hypothetical protein [Acidaminobacter sp.]